MSKFFRLAVAALAAVAGSLVFVSVAEAGIGAGASPSFPQDPAISGVRVGGTYSATISMRNFNSNPDEAAVNTVCNFSDTAPPCTPSTSSALQEDPGINLMLSCGLLGNDSICAPGGADPGVFQITSAATGVAGTACAGTVFTITSTDAGFGTLRFEPNDGSNVLLNGLLAECVIGFNYEVLRVPTIDSDATRPGVQTIQITDNVQWSAATNTNASARGTTPGTTVLQALPSITTTASAAVTLGSGTITDSAVVSGRVNPIDGATVTFSLYGPNNATCTGTPIFTSTVPQGTANGPVTSEPYTPTAVGTYRWIASYSGDANNAPVSGACNDANESVVVSPGQPTLVTAASPAIRLGAGDLTDTATVSGRVGPLASTVSFSLFGPDDATCAGPAIFTDNNRALPTTSDSVTSAGYTPTAPGTYRWIASYSGDANNLPATGACNDAGESTLVDKAQPVLATNAGDNIAIGGQLTDTATVTGRVSAAAATLDFRLYGPNDTTCTGTPAFEQLAVPFAATDTSVTSAAFTPTAVGTYRWVVTYSGDANNNGAVGVCGDPLETVEVTLGAPTIVTEASASVPVGVGQLSDAAVVNGRVDPQPGATVSFRLYGPGDTTCSAAPVFEDLNVAYPVGGGTVRSGTYTPTVAGTYRWIATYSGDANNAPAIGVCGEPSETVVVTAAVAPELPATGSETQILMRSGGALFLVGIAMVGLGSRKRYAR